MNYDLEERCAKFGEDVIDFIKKIKLNKLNDNILNQLLRSAISIGANYMGANQASSKKDFQNKIRISQKEANETKHWLRMLAKFDENLINNCRIFWKEAHESTLIFAKISKSCKN